MAMPTTGMASHTVRMREAVGPSMVPPAAMPAPSVPPTRRNADGIGMSATVDMNMSVEAVRRMMAEMMGRMVAPFTSWLPTVSATAPPCVTAPRNDATPTMSELR